MGRFRTLYDAIGRYGTLRDAMDARNAILSNWTLV
jgi:hypothetical protein